MTNYDLTVFTQKRYFQVDNEDKIQIKCELLLSWFCVVERSCEERVRWCDAMKDVVMTTPQEIDKKTKGEV